MQLDLTDSSRRRSRRSLPSYLLGGVLGAMLAVFMPLLDAQARRAVILNVDGAIGPAVADYVVRELEAASPIDTGLVVLRLDTPGGLDTSMREIIRAILASPVPVAVYVAPSGSRAASAGTFIIYAGAIAAMAPGTNLGAASLIQLAKPPPSPAGRQEQPPEKTDPGDAESRKAVNDAVAYIRSLADLHGRNADWATEAVRGAASLPALEAQKLRVIDVIADDVPDLLRKIDGRAAIVGAKSVRLATAGLDVVTVNPDWRTGLLATITNPNVAYLLMLLGIFGLTMELMNPGAIAPGVVGGISLLTALFALNMLPIDYAGAGLVLLGLAFMVAEVFIGSFGVIGAGGLVALALGSIIMFRSNALEYRLSLPLVAATTIVAGGFLILVLAMIRHGTRRRVITGREAMIGAEGETVGWQGTNGRVQVKGEIWLAQADRSLQPGTRIRVVARKDLVLTVEPI
jgi:membrane-bound serine protease (ClpP class)